MIHVMSATETPVTPAVIAWALDEDGRAIEEIAERVHADADDLRAWADGRHRPSRGQLSSLAEALGRPRALFFLPRPPQDAALPTSFRHLAGDDRRDISAVARRWIRQARRAQRFGAWLRQEVGRGPVDLPLVRSHSEPTTAAMKTRQWLELTNDEQLGWVDQYAALRAWRRIIEDTGVFVFQFEIGDGEIRGFSAWDELAPMITLNSSNLIPGARIFTLGHELGHLVRRADAACLDWVVPGRGTDHGIERWCERYSAALLLPEDLVHEALPRAVSTRSELDLVSKLASRAKVSLRASALRLIDLEFVSQSVYAQVEAIARPRRSSSGGGTLRRPQKRLREYGPELPRLVDDAVEAGRMTTRDALDLLRLPVEDYRQLADSAREEIARR
jgi:Zn-dependent peptidase ImmA (M78 family)